MAGMSDITIIGNEYRPCIVKGKKALFHRYEIYESLAEMHRKRINAIVEIEERTSIKSRSNRN